MRNIILIICAFVFGFAQPLYAQEAVTSFDKNQQAVEVQQKTTQTEKQQATVYCNDCKWQGAESELKDGKCPKCGSANLTITRHVNLEEQQRLKDQQQTIEQLNKQREITDMQKSLDNIRKINEFNQQQRNINEINKINQMQKLLDDIRRINQQNQRK